MFPPAAALKQVGIGLWVGEVLPPQPQQWSSRTTSPGPHTGSHTPTPHPPHRLADPTRLIRVLWRLERAAPPPPPWWQRLLDLCCCYWCCCRRR